MKYKVCVVTVTYGDRFYLLKQVIDASFNEGVSKIIVVDNCSSKNSRNQLKDYERKYVE
ncbi:MULTISPECIES: glycosyltransferase family 2 protein [Pseudomonadati]|jgi:GT2 family glycosyltransferase|uniref:glycosyltransferase family 2 protein n=1 Tax=Pseudomonadati TaxID=3379134 RepID=UPI003D0AA71B